VPKYAFVFVSKGQAAAAGNVAHGMVEIPAGQTEVIVPLYTSDSKWWDIANHNGEPWSGSGTWNISVVLVPDITPSTITDDVDMYGGSTQFTSLVVTRSLVGLINLAPSNQLAWSDKFVMFNGEVKSDGKTSFPGNPSNTVALNKQAAKSEGQYAFFNSDGSVKAEDDGDK
jgi:hypothetical protein